MVHQEIYSCQRQIHFIVSREVCPPLLLLPDGRWRKGETFSILPSRVTTNSNLRTRGRWEEYSLDATSSSAAWPSFFLQNKPANTCSSVHGYFKCSVAARCWICLSTTELEPVRIWNIVCREDIALYHEEWQLNKYQFLLTECGKNNPITNHRASEKVLKSGVVGVQT